MSECAENLSTGALAAKLPGLHLMGDLYECACGPAPMFDRDWLRQRCLNLVSKAGLTATGDYFHAFAGGGVTGAVVLSESHLSVHTWPEHRYVTLDVYVCNYSANNRNKARQLFDRLLETFASRAPRVFALDRA
jgi:S-adenosylmethionine decarboxylase